MHSNARQADHRDDFRDREAVRWHVAAYWGFFRRHRTVVAALSQAAVVDETFARRSRELLEPDLHHIADHLAELGGPGDPLVRASLFTTVVSSVASAWLGAGGPALTDDEAIDLLTTFVHGGLSAR